MSTKTTLQNLKDAVTEMHGCDSRYVGFVRVTGKFEGETVWDGMVDVFDLIDHPTAQRAYAWVHETDEGKTRHVVVLHEPPVDSPEAAVRAAIAAEHASG